MSFIKSLAWGAKDIHSRAWLQIARGIEKLIEDTATGNPLKFVTDVAKPLNKLKASFFPVQSGTGDPSPTNVRPINGFTGLNVKHFGENVIEINRNTETTVNGLTFTPIKDSNNKTVAIKVKGTTNASNTFFNLNYVAGQVAFPVGTYKVSGYTDKVSFRVYALIDGVDTKIYDSTSQTEFSITSSMTQAHMRLQISNSGTVVDETIYPIVVPSSETIETYPVTFPALGKNLFSTVLQQGTIKGIDGTPVSNNTRVRTKNFIDVKAGTYVISAVGAYYGYVVVYDVNGNYLQNETSYFGSLPMTKTILGDRKIKIVFRGENDSDLITPSDVTNVQLESGTTPTTYEPFNNTLYGGYVDLVTGEVWATWAEIASYDGETLSGRWLSDRDVYTAGSTPSTGAQVAYELSTPNLITTLTPQQITALIGNNTVWSDGNGDCEVTFLKKG